jgi:hypothetical protein
LHLLNSNLPPVNALVGSKGFQFSGCNSYAMLCSTNGKNNFRAGNIVSNSRSRRQCKNNNDQQYLQTIRGGNTFGSDGKNFYLNQNGRKIASFTLMKPTTQTRMYYNFNSKFNRLNGGQSRSFGKSMGQMRTNMGMRPNMPMRPAGPSHSSFNGMSMAKSGGSRSMSMQMGSMSMQMGSMRQMGPQRPMNQMQSMGFSHQMNGGGHMGSMKMMSSNQRM